MTKFVPKFWKPGTEGPGVLLNEERTASPGGQDTTSVKYNPNSSLSIEKQRQRLPVFKHRTNILYLVENFQTVVIVGETGCGKSTQIPQYLLEAGWNVQGKLVGVTQPRRVAAVTVANRIAEERGQVTGQDVGYAIRFEDVTDPETTKIKVLTDGLLIREIMADPLLRQYRVIMLDEAHERSLNTDIIVGLLKKIQKKRADLRIIITSATLDAEEVRDFFNTNETNDPSKDTAAILTVEGRTFPVDIYFSIDPVPDYVKAAVETVTKIHVQEKAGDILAFMTGQEEVQQVVSLLIEEARKLNKTENVMKMKVLPMYGSLPASDQMRVFDRTSHFTRKIVIATNIAETSITINGIVYIVDCGFVKIKAYQAKSGIESLVVIPVSQASANQRAGRAGRLHAGKAYRLYTEESFLQLPKTAVPEMQRCNLASPILQLKALGIDNILRFNFLSAPPAQNMVNGLELLFALGALDDNGILTDPLGLRMAEFPLSPMFAKLLLVSGDYGCSEEALTVSAMMQIQNVFLNPPKQKTTADRAKRKFAVAEGDHITMINVYAAFLKNNKSSRWCNENFLNYKGLVRAVEVREQLKRLLRKFNVPLKSCQGDVDVIRRCLTAGFFANAAKFHYTGVYKTIRHGHILHIHPMSVLHTEKPPPWVLFNEVVQTTREFMRDVTVIRPEWLTELAPHFYQFGTDREIAAKRAKLDE
ncbi:probable ATP-dependent RNA helicase DHX35 [Liolophura sinensis]|uniref:probable ATP-dependent RNA helicase DHX35 n=1 Tax=Liolophura sinensis TaxID=3198878 RepID=UPI00315876F8